MKPGKYKAKVKEYGLVEGKSSPQVKVVFALDNGQDYAWYGQLATEKNQEITTKNLMTLGATKENIQKVEDGITSGVLNTFKEFEVVIEDRSYNGKTYTEIKFINDPSVPRTTQAFTKGTGALGVLKGHAAQIASETGASAPKGEDVPF